jgi:tRNA(Arg) A34 adenosine deaminase TadA
MRQASDNKFCQMQNPFLLRAIELAVNNVIHHQGGPFGAVVVRNGEIVAEGTNLVTANNDPTAHAEIVAIRKACQHFGSFELKGCDVYTSCEPCPMCLAAIYWSRANRIVYAADRQDAAAAGFDDDFLYRELSLPLGERSLPIEQLHRKEAIAAFEAWRNDYGKIRY